MGNNCWDEWKFYFESKGYKCIAPAWPHKNASPEELRNRHPDPAIASLRLESLMEYFEALINKLPERPIIIGHSLGGLIAQVLLQRGLGSAGVAIHSFPASGIGQSKFSFLRALWESVGLFTSTRKTYMMSFRKWSRSVANGMDCKQQKQLFYKYATPESKLIIRDTFRSSSKINFKGRHAPLLLISGSSDKIIPSSMNYDNYKKYKMGHSITDYMEFKGRNHLVFDQPAGREEADFALYWMQGIK